MMAEKSEKQTWWRGVEEGVPRLRPVGGGREESKQRCVFVVCGCGCSYKSRVEGRQQECTNGGAKVLFHGKAGAEGTQESGKRSSPQSEAGKQQGVAAGAAPCCGWLGLAIITPTLGHDDDVLAGEDENKGGRKARRPGNGGRITCPCCISPQPTCVCVLGVGGVSI